MVEEVAIYYHERSKLASALLYQVLEVVPQFHLSRSILIGLFKDRFKVCAFLDQINQECVSNIAYLSDIILEDSVNVDELDTIIEFHGVGLVVRECHPYSLVGEDQVTCLEVVHDLDLDHLVQ